MATLTLKKPTPGDFYIADVGIKIPGSGEDTYTDECLIRHIVQSEIVRASVANGTLVVNDGTQDLSAQNGQVYLRILWLLAGLGTSFPSQVLYPFMPIRTRRHWALQQNAGATSVVGDGMSTVPTTNGTASVHNDTSEGQFINYASQAIVDRDAGWTSATFTMIQRRHKPAFLVKFKTGPAAADVQNVRMWLGLFSANPMASSSPAIHLAAFRYATDVDGTAFWRCVTNNGVGPATVTATTVAVAADTAYELMIDMSDAANVKFFINGVLVATHTATLPSSTQDLGHNEQLRTLNAVAHNLRLSRAFMEHLP